MKSRCTHAFAVCLAVAVSSQTFGQARFVIEGGVTPDSGQLTIPLDTETDFAISVINEGPAEIAGPALTGFNFDGLVPSIDDIVTFESWEWVFPGASDPQKWSISDPPGVAAFAFAAGVPFPPGSTLEVATFSLIAHGNELSIGETFELILDDDGQPLVDENFELVEIVEGSLNHTILVVPEPAGIAILAVGVVMLRKTKRRLRS